MTAVSIIQSAWDGELHEGMNMAESLLWYQSRLLSLEYKSGGVPVDEAKKLKQQYVSQFIKNQTKLEMQARQIEETAKRYQEMEPLISDYRKEPTKVKADRIMDLFDGLEEK